MEHTKESDVVSHREAAENGPNGDTYPTRTEAVAEDELQPKLHTKTLLIVATVSFVQFALLIQLVATGAFESVVAAVVGGASISNWMFTAITITFVALAVPVSQTADYWGRRWPLIILCLLGFVGTLITSRADSMGMAIAGEAFVGAAFSATPLTFAVASEVLPHRHRLAGQACLNTFAAGGSIFSLLLGSHLIQTQGPQAFRTLYYINAGVFFLAAILTFVAYRPPLRDSQTSLTTREKLRRLDWLGYSITICAAVLFIVGLSWAQNPYPWRNVHVLAPLVIGGLLFLLLGIYAWKLRPDGFIHRRLFSKDRNMAISLLGILCEGLVFGTANIYVPFQLTIVNGLGSFRVCLIFSLVFICYGLFGPVGAIFCSRYKQVKSLNIVGFAFLLIFSACMATSKTGDEAAMWGFQVFLGTGLALVLCALVTLAQLSASPDLISTSSGLMAGTRSLGVTIAVAVDGAIFNTKIAETLPKRVTAAALKAGLPSSSVGQLLKDLVANKTDALAEIPGISPKIIEASVGALKMAYLDSMHAVWYLSCAVAAVGLVLACVSINPTKDLNYKIDAPAESEDALYD